MDAIVTAGGIPRPEDPLYTYSHGDSKALIDVAGKPMIQWVLDALGNAKQVDNVIIIGLSPKSGITCKRPIYYVSNQGRMLANIVAGVDKALELNKRNKYVLVVSSDIPTLKSEMVDWLVHDYKMEPWTAHMLIGYQGQYDVVTVAGSMALRLPRSALPR